MLTHPHHFCKQQKLDAVKLANKQTENETKTNRKYYFICAARRRCCCCRFCSFLCVCAVFYLNIVDISRFDACINCLLSIAKNWSQCQMWEKSLWFNAARPVKFNYPWCHVHTHARISYHRIHLINFSTRPPSTHPRPPQKKPREKKSGLIHRSS